MTKRALVTLSALVLLGAGAARVNAVDNGPKDDRPAMTERRWHGTESPDRPEGVRQDVTRPGDHITYDVWHNCAFRRIHVRVKREIVTPPNGRAVGSVTELPGEMERVRREELPPRDPACDNVNPTPEQEAEVRDRRPANPAEALAWAGMTP